MTKPARSPVRGYNHNIQFHGHVFHVQTEDSGTGHARVFTHLFSEGTILASKKHEYEADSAEDAVRLHMQRLHKAMIKELKEGVHDTRIEAFFKARGIPITMGDRPSLIQMPVVTDTPAVPALAVVPELAPPPSAEPTQARTSGDGVPDRPLAVSGSIEAVGQPKRSDPPVATPAPAPAPASVVVSPTQPPPRKVVVVKPPEVKRPPVVVTSSAEGVVVKRNVVINVGGGVGPVQGQVSRGTALPRQAPRPAVPYVVREGSYPLPTVSRGSGGVAAQPPQPTNEAPSGPPSARDVRMPWDGGAPSSGLRRTGAVSEHTPQGRAIVGSTEAAMRTRTPGQTNPPSQLSERTPAERAFSTDLPSDKSLDEVILEYLSDDAE